MHRCNNCKKTYKEPVEQCKVCNSTNIVKIEPRGHNKTTESTETTPIEVNEEFEQERYNITIIVITALVTGLIGLFIVLGISNHIINNAEILNSGGCDVEKQLIQERYENNKEVLIYYITESGILQVTKDFNQVVGFIAQYGK